MDGLAPGRRLPSRSSSTFTPRLSVVIPCEAETADLVVFVKLRGEPAAFRSSAPFLSDGVAMSAGVIGGVAAAGLTAAASIMAVRWRSKRSRHRAAA